MLVPRHHHSSVPAQAEARHKDVTVHLPVQISLFLQPGNRSLSSVRTMLPLTLSPQESHAIETEALQQRTSKDTVLMVHFKTMLREHERMQEIFRQTRHCYPGMQVEMDVQLLGEIIWKQS